MKVAKLDLSVASADWAYFMKNGTDATTFSIMCARAAARNGFHLNVTGEPALFYLRVTDDDSLMLHQKWVAECVSRGLFITSHHNHFINAALSDEDIDLCVDIADDAFAAVRAKV